jgi:hypothetical protein
MDNPESSSTDSNQLKNLNRWLAGLVVFIIIWTVGVLAVVQHKDEPKAYTPVVIVDEATGKVTNPTYVNLFPKGIAAPVIPKNTAYQRREVYQVMDFVIINYFFVEGIVMERNGENYTVMYKDENRVLQKVIVPRELLMSPSPGTAVNPASLISP